MRVAVGHLFDAHHERRLEFPGGHCHQPGAERGPAGPASRVDFDGGDLQPGPVCHERSEVVLAVDDARHHVTDEETLDAFAPGVFQRGKDGIRGNLADGFFPLFVNFGLADPDDGDCLHRKPFLPQRTRRAQRGLKFNGCMVGFYPMILPEAIRMVKKSRARVAHQPNQQTGDDQSADSRDHLCYNLPR